MKPSKRCLRSEAITDRSVDASVTARLGERILGTETGLGGDDVGPSTPLVEQIGDGSEFFGCIPTSFKAEFQTEQTPHVVLPQVDVCSVDLFRLLDMPLLQQEGA